MAIGHDSRVSMAVIQGQGFSGKKSFTDRDFCVISEQASACGLIDLVIRNR